DELLGRVPRPTSIPEALDKEFRSAVGDVFDRIMTAVDNSGCTDEHRALNYLALRDPGIYASTAAALTRSSSLTAIETKRSHLSGLNKIIDVVLTYTDRLTDFEEKVAISVDVTGEWPFLVRKLSPFVDH